MKLLDSTQLLLCFTILLLIEIITKNNSKIMPNLFLCSVHSNGNCF
jgi:hypothetical protein